MIDDYVQRMLYATTRSKLNLNSCQLTLLCFFLYTIRVWYLKENTSINLIEPGKTRSHYIQNRKMHIAKFQRKARCFAMTVFDTLLFHLWIKDIEHKPERFGSYLLLFGTEKEKVF